MLENVIHQINFDPLLDWWIIMTLAGLAMLLSIFSWVRQGRGSPYRAALYLLLLALLANPGWTEEKRKPLDDVVAIIVDETGSQSIGERRAVTETALARLEAALSQHKNITTRIKRVTDNLDRPEDGGEGGGEGGGQGSNLYAARKELLTDVPAGRVGATFMITDGLIHDIPPKLVEGGDGQGPVHGLLSARSSEYDRVLRLVEAPGFGIVNKSVKIVVRVDDQGIDTPPGAKKVQLTVRQDDENPRQFSVDPGRDTELEVSLTHGGDNLVTIEAEALDGELSARNNVAHMVINGIRDRLKVLLVSGEPHMGERGWRNILKSDPSVDLVHFTILRPPEKYNDTPIRELSLIPFPINELFEIKLNDFDLVIFDRYRRRGVLHSRYLRNIANYVAEGGAFLEAAGPSFATALSLYRTPLATILPGRPTGEILTQPFHPAISPLGQKHPVTAPLHRPQAQTPPWGRWFRLIDSEPLRGDILMTGAAGRPLLILERYDQGRVAQLLSDHSWLWSRGFEGGGPQGELLRRLAHWLMKEPELEEERLEARVEGRRITVIRHSLNGDHVAAEIRTPSGTVTAVPLQAKAGGEYHGSVEIDQAGLYMLTQGDIQAPVAVGSLNPLEFSRLRGTEAPLQRLQQTTGGGNVWLTERPFPAFRRISATSRSAGSEWLGIRKNNRYQITGYRQTRLIPFWIALLLAGGLLGLAWWRESR